MHYIIEPQLVGNRKLPGKFEAFHWFPLYSIASVQLQDRIHIGGTLYLPWGISLSWGVSAIEWYDSPTVAALPWLTLRRPMTDQEQQDYDEHCALESYWGAV